MDVTFGPMIFSDFVLVDDEIVRVLSETRLGANATLCRLGVDPGGIDTDHFLALRAIGILVRMPKNEHRSHLPPNLFIMDRTLASDKDGSWRLIFRADTARRAPTRLRSACWAPESRDEPGRAGEAGFPAFLRCSHTQPPSECCKTQFFYKSWRFNVRTFQASSRASVPDTMACGARLRISCRAMASTSRRRPSWERTINTLRLILAHLHDVFPSHPGFTIGELHG